MKRTRGGGPIHGCRTGPCWLAVEACWRTGTRLHRSLPRPRAVAVPAAVERPRPQITQGRGPRRPPDGDVTARRGQIGSLWARRHWRAHAWPSPLCAVARAQPSYPPVPGRAGKSATQHRVSQPAPLARDGMPCPPPDQQAPHGPRPGFPDAKATRRDARARQRSRRMAHPRPPFSARPAPWTGRGRRRARWARRRRLVQSTWGGGGGRAAYRCARSETGASGGRSECTACAANSAGPPPRRLVVSSPPSWPAAEEPVVSSPPVVMAAARLPAGCLFYFLFFIFIYLFIYFVKRVTRMQSSRPWRQVA